MSRLPRPSPRRRAFSVLEMVLASFLTTLLASLVAATWISFGRPVVDAGIRCRLAREAMLAAQCLARDLGGALSDPDGRLGERKVGLLVGRMQPGGDQLRLCFDGPDGNGVADWDSSDTVISYEVNNGALIRANENTGVVTTVARLVDSVEFADWTGGSGVAVTLTFRFRRTTLSYVLVGVDP